MTKAKKHIRTSPPNLAGFTALELARKIPVAEAAAINSIHPQTFKKNYAHLIHPLGVRRRGVTLRDAITLPPPPE
jgi:hypothetical protein